MKAVIQRVKKASVSVQGKLISEIGPGLLTLLGVEKGDSEEQVKKMVDKLLNLRIFEDSAGKMNLSLLDSKGQHLIVSQFTLAGNCSKGRRPSFDTAERPEKAQELYLKAISESQALGVHTLGGQFQAEMEVALVNDGPVTFVCEVPNGAQGKDPG